MLGYDTAEEKAAEWNISLRYVQHLCRMEKIEGAVKRAGAWFIPGEAPLPAKSTKSGAKGFKFIGTKNRIFNNAIELFLLRGFDNVSFKDIAVSLGVQQSTIYNHFKSKQELLDTIYDFYCHYYAKERLSLKDIEPKLQKGCVMDIIECIRYDFEEDCRQRMSDITMIIFQRLGIDGRATEIAKSLIVDEGIKYVEDVFDRAVEGGRFAPFDTHAIAVFINSIRIFTLYCWIVETSPENRMKLSKEDQTLCKYAEFFLTDLYPPVTNNRV